MIRDYHLRNFKSYSQLDMAFTAANVVVGLNSSGKSSLFQPLLVACQSEMTGALRANRLALNGPLLSIGTGQDLLFEFAEIEETVIAWNDIEIRVPYQREAMEVDFGLTGTFGSDPPISQTLYVSNARIAPRSLYERYRQYARQAPAVGVYGEGAPGYIAAHGNASPRGERAKRNTATTGSLLEQVNFWMARISPGVSVNLEEFHQLDGLALRFGFEGKSGVRSRAYRAVNVGFGLTHSLSVVTALVAAETGTLLVIEAPEANLHPRAQEQLGHLIGQAAGDGVQVIVETHSPDVVRGIGKAVASGWLARSQLTMHYCIRTDAETQVAHAQVDHSGRLAHVGGYDAVPAEYFRQFLQV